MQVRRRPSESSSCRLPGNLLPHGTCGRLWGQQAEAQRAASRVEEDRQGRRPASRPCHLSAVTRDKGSQPASQPMAALSRRVRAAPLPPYPGPISNLDPVQARRTLQRTPLTNRTLMSVNSLRSSRRVWPCAHSAGWRPVSLSHAVPSQQPAERPARRSPCSASARVGSTIDAASQLQSWLQGRRCMLVLGTEQAGRASANGQLTLVM
jgi:hypothetical protein